MRSPILLLALLVCTPAVARDSGQYTNAPEAVRSWFKSVKSPRGVPCCDVADGHRTDYDMRNDGYWVPIAGKWLAVPHEAVVEGASNPVGEAVVWYTAYGEHVVIRCFVPGGGV